MISLPEADVTRAINWWEHLSDNLTNGWRLNVDYHESKKFLGATDLGTPHSCGFYLQELPDSHSEEPRAPCGSERERGKVIIQSILDRKSTRLNSSHT